MTKQNRQLLVAAALVAATSVWSAAQAPQPATPPPRRATAAPGAGEVRRRGRGAQGPPQPMSFFVTSRPIGKGANLGGLAGADAHCQALATAAGAGNRTWHAYLSTQGPNAVNARDRIGEGPWYNAKGQRIAQNLAELHGDTLDLARLGNSVTRVTAMSEKGYQSTGWAQRPNQHDMLTGSQPDGRAFTDAADHTCSNWTSEAATGSAQLGHHDRAGGNNISWNSTHPSRGCSRENLVSTGGEALLLFRPGRAGGAVGEPEQDHRWRSSGYSAPERRQRLLPEHVGARDDRRRCRRAAIVNSAPTASRPGAGRHGMSRTWRLRPS